MPDNSNIKSRTLLVQRIVARVMAASCILPLAAGCTGSTSKSQPISIPSSAGSASESKANPETNTANAKPAKLDDSPAADAIKVAGGEVKTGSNGSITEVTFRDQPITDAIATEIGKLKSVTKLSLYESEMTSVGWGALGALTSVQHFDLRNCSVDNAQLRTAAKNMTRLRSLRLNGLNGKTTVDDDGLVFLKDCPELKVLAVDYLWVSVDTLALLPNPDGLLELYAAKTLADDETLGLIKDWKSLKKLRVANTSISDNGLADIASMQLEELDLSECQQFSDAGMQSVGKIISLKRLNLWRTPITDSGVGHLAGLVSLQWLNLDNIALTDTGLKSLAGMQQLAFLHLGSTQVTDAGMQHLVGLKSLNDLRITRTAVTEDGVGPVKEAHPGMNVQIKYIAGK